MHPKTLAWTASLCTCLLLFAGMALPASSSDPSPQLMSTEAPDAWSCDPSGQLVCAGVNAGADVTCNLEGSEVSCTYTYGQLMGAASPLYLPGEAAFQWSATIEVCFTDPDGPGQSCEVTTEGGSDTCTFPAGFWCILSLGPNETDLGPYTLEMGQCVEVTVSPTATARAWTPAQDPALAQASFTNGWPNAGGECLLDNGR